MGCLSADIDFSVSKYMTAEALSAVINYQLLQWGKIIWTRRRRNDFQPSVKGIIQRAYTQTGKPVVGYLTDEYMLPCWTVIKNTELHEK